MKLTTTNLFFAIFIFAAATMMASVEPVSAEDDTVAVQNLTVFRGVTVSGAIADLQESDDSRMAFNPGFTLTSNEAPVWLVLDAVLPNPQRENLSFQIESQANTPGLTLTFESLNFDTNQFQVIGSESVSFNSDSVVSADISNASDFVSTNGDVSSRVGWRKTGITIIYPWEVSIDQATWVSAPTVSTVTDIDGNEYRTVQIGNQTWMAENLKVTTLNDGTPVTEFVWTPGNNDWFFDGTTVPMYTYPDTSDLNNLYDEELPDDFYGFLYSHATLETGLLAPAGWRIPTLADFQELESFLSANGQAGNEATALKTSIGWTFADGTDDVCFAALPNGYCTTTGHGTGAQAIATFVTSDVNGSERTLVQLLNTNTEVLVASEDIRFGGAIRCIKE